MPCESGEHGAWSARDIRVRQPFFGSKDTRHGDQIEVEFQTRDHPVTFTAKVLLDLSQIRT